MDYEGKEWDAWLQHNGIRCQRTSPYTSEKIVEAERYNRTVLERVRAMMDDSVLGEQWCAEAALTANYLSDRVPQRGQATTPFQAFHCKQPSVTHLRVFGCPASAYTPKQIRRKVQPRAKRGIFLGYGIKQTGYRVLSDGRVGTHRDVRCDESVSLKPVRDRDTSIETEGLDFKVEDATPVWGDTLADTPSDDTAPYESAPLE